MLRSLRTSFPISRRPRLKAVLSALTVFLSAIIIGGCAASEDDTITASTSGREPGPEHTRAPVDFMVGINEPRTADWDFLLLDDELLIAAGINTVALEPPLLITERAGGRPRVILEGAAVTVPGMVGSAHEKGFSVFLAPTTASPGFQEAVTMDDMTLERLSEDAVAWAETAEKEQVELFAPLSRCNLVLGGELAGEWIMDILPEIREVYSGPLAAKVVADIGGPPPAGDRHAFEAIEYTGYDYILIDLHPWGEKYDSEGFRRYVESVIAAAEGVVARDGLSGFMIGDIRLAREGDDSNRYTGEPAMNEQQQIEALVSAYEAGSTAARGFFYYGWSLADYGARGYPVEETLARLFGDSVADGPSGGTGTGATATTPSTIADTITENG